MVLLVSSTKRPRNKQYQSEVTSLRSLIPRAWHLHFRNSHRCSFAPLPQSWSRRLKPHLPDTLGERVEHCTVSWAEWPFNRYDLMEVCNTKNWLTTDSQTCNSGFHPLHIPTYTPRACHLKANKLVPWSIFWDNTMPLNLFYHLFFLPKPCKFWSFTI